MFPIIWRCCILCVNISKESHFPVGSEIDLVLETSKFLPISLPLTHLAKPQPCLNPAFCLLPVCICAAELGEAQRKFSFHGRKYLGTEFLGHTFNLMRKCHAVFQRGCTSLPQVRPIKIVNQDVMCYSSANRQTNENPPLIR